MRLRLVSLLSATVLLAACGGGSDGAITIGSTAATSSASLDEELCAVFGSDSAGPDEEFVAAMPEAYRGAAQSIVDFGTAMDAMGDNDDGSIDALVDALTKDGVAAELREFAVFAEQECGQSEGSIAIGGMATAAEMASEPEDADYCAAIEAGFATDDGGPEELAALAEIAPGTHRDPLSVLTEIDPETMTTEDEDELFGPLFGLGVYAESACGIDGALAQMLLGAMFIGMGDLPDVDMDTGETTDTSLPEGVDPAQYPDITADAANAAVPTGSSLSFEVRSADLEDDGEYLASVVVPAGWTSEMAFNVEFSPPEDSGASIFTGMEVGAGCDGNCQPTDWEARLRGEMGALASFLSSHPSAAEAPVSGSEGVALTDTTDEVAALVLRWDDGADKYFSCEVLLEDDQADLLPAFVAACESSRPAWFAAG